MIVGIENASHVSLIMHVEAALLREHYSSTVRSALQVWMSITIKTLHPLLYPIQDAAPAQLFAEDTVMRRTQGMEVKMLVVPVFLL